MLSQKPASSGALQGNADVAPASYGVLALLCLVYVLNYIDRSLIFILFPPIKKELQLSDFQMALLGSTAFVLFYTLLGIPCGRLADRVVRKNMIGIGLLVWSVFSGLTGFAAQFSSLFACRVLVGVGESTLGPAALSLLSDLFPPRLRATASALYSAGIPIGAGLALYLGGRLGQDHGWRFAFMVLGFPGVLLALVVFLLREPARGVHDSAPISHADPHKLAPTDIGLLFRIPTLRYHYAGYAFSSLAGTCLSMWMPSYLSRTRGMPLSQVGLYTGIAAMIGGLLGSIVGGLGADAWRRVHRGGRMLFCAVAALCSAATWLVLLHTDSLRLFFFCYGLLMGTGLSWLGPAAADMQDIAGPKLRGLGIGIYFFIVNVIAGGIAPPCIGKLNDVLGVAQDPLQMRRSLLVAPLACVLSAVLLYLGARSAARGSSRALDRPAERLHERR
ncbi:MAG: MFS transporter [Myxococcales bacterium]|nr:MFS transporter [Myxococcales bacterium]